MSTPLDRVSFTLDRLWRLCPDLPVLAVQWLEVKYPFLAVQERLLREAARTPTGRVHQAHRPLRTIARSVSAACVIAVRGGRCVLLAVYLSLLLLELRLSLRKPIALLRRRRVDVIAKTWCFDAIRTPDRRDFYYGDFQQRLAARGVPTLLLCGDGTDGRLSVRRWRAFAKVHAATVEQAARLPELCLLQPGVPFVMAARQLRTALRLAGIFVRARDPLLRQASREALRDCLSRQTMENGLQFWIGRTAVKTWGARAFVALYEANSWERCAWWGAKTASADCRTIGYQHTTIFPNARSLMRPYVDRRDIRMRLIPDAVLCLGQGTVERLRPGHDPHQVRLVRFGSFRHNGAHATHPADPIRRAILVTPIGVQSEIALLFRFISECARRLPGHTCILRAHPAIPMAKALQGVPRKILELPNVVISDRASINEDFARASILLYRGSSAVFYATLHGLLPIYLEAGDVVDQNPLSGFGGWGKRCASVEQFVGLVAQHERTPAHQLAQEWSAAVHAVHDYTGPVEDESIDRFLEVAGLPA